MSDLLTFAESMFELTGALTERIEPEGLEVISPESLQQTMSIPELTRLGFGAELPKNSQRVSLESDWIERLEKAMGVRGRLVRRVLPCELSSPSGPERIVQHTLELVNATYRLENVTPAWTRYLLMTFHYTAVSDEKRDGLLALGLNLNSGSTLDNFLPDLLDTLALEPMNEPTVLSAQEPLPAHWDASLLEILLKRTLATRIEFKLNRFLKSMHRRQVRDLMRIHDYHEGMRQELLVQLNERQQKKELSEKQQRDQTRIQQRLDPIAREYLAKVNDVKQKYTMTMTADWVQTLELIMPVQRFELLIKRRKGERRLALDWNPLVRKLEQPACEYSYTWEKSRLVCDEQLHLVSPQAHAPCLHCAKVYCRACHPRQCPKCKMPKLLPVHS